MVTFQGTISLNSLTREVNNKLASICQKEFNSRNGVSIGNKENLFKVALNCVWEKYWVWKHDLFITDMQLYLVYSYLRIIAKNNKIIVPTTKELKKHLPFKHKVRPVLNNKATKIEYISLMNSLAAHSLEYFPKEEKKKQGKKKIYKCNCLAIANQTYEFMQQKYNNNMATPADVTIERNNGRSREALEFPYRVVIRFK